MRNCQHCATELLAHPNGTLHCNGCGCCFIADARTVRTGHPTCPVARTTPIEAPAALSSELAAPTERPDMSEIPLSQSTGESEAVVPGEGAEAAPEVAPLPPTRRGRRRMAD